MADQFGSSCVGAARYAAAADPVKTSKYAATQQVGNKMLTKVVGCRMVPGETNHANRHTNRWRASMSGSSHVITADVVVVGAGAAGASAAVAAGRAGADVLLV